ncbi:MAG: extracellular solute-binding protein [Syntrophobacteraceae bacterium]|nr:extracellular solute-binding protein [Syntrophobacteraceae bacterium]
MMLILALCLPAMSLAANKRFDGVVIKVGVMSAPAIGYPAKAHARTWESVTGGTVQIIDFPYDQLFSNYMKGLTAEENVFDVIFFASQWTGDFFPFLAELPADLASHEDLDDILPIYLDRLMKWEGKTVAVTIDGDLYFGYYRKDLFEDPANRNEFRAKYGYNLAPPDTWSQYRDMAEFFHGRKGPDGRTVSGTTEPFAPGTQQFWDVFSRASAYTNHRGSPGAQFFAPDTMAPQVNNPGWVRAVQEYVDILKFCPPGSDEFGILDTRKAFVRGDAAMTLDWGDTGPLSADPNNSAVVGRVGYFVLPGTTEVWDGPGKRWEALQRPQKVPFLAFGGWVGGVPRNSRQKEAAWDFIMWYGNPENSLGDVVKSNTGINPYRFSHFTNMDAWTRSFSAPCASEYLEVIRVSLESPNVALDLRIPGFNDYTLAFEKQVYSAVKGEIPVRKAMDQVAAEWDQITDRLGRAKQMSIYRSSMGLPRK